MFMKTFKKILAVVMVICLCTATFALGASAGRKTALPTSAGIEALRDEFVTDVAPKAGGYELDYSYYSPVGSNDSTKYPVVIFLHGIGHADYIDAQVDDSDMPYWASKELQGRFTAGGAFILLPRAPEDKLVYWSTSLVESLRSVIDDFLAKNGKNVDTTKIFIGGSSAGGEMVWNMLSAYPEYFAGAFPIAGTGTVSAGDVQKCKDVAIWMISSIKDPVINYVLITKPLWNNVCEYNAHPENCRLSSFSNVTEPAGNSASDNHHMAKVVTYDMHMLDGSTYPDVTHEDGNGNELSLVSPNGMIQWMNSVSSDFDGNGEIADDFEVSLPAEILNYIRNLILKIVNIFQRILGL